jgi:hypothetical protein
MELTYRGIKYNRATATPVEMIEIGEDMMFLGRSFKGTMPKALPPQFPSGYLKYRGVGYTA